MGESRLGWREPRVQKRPAIQQERTTVRMEGIVVRAQNGMLLHQQGPRNGTEKTGKGSHSLPGTWPLGVRLPTSHPPDCPCWKMQPLLRKEELRTMKGTMRESICSRASRPTETSQGLWDNLGLLPSDISKFRSSAATKGARHGHVQCGPTMRCPKPC